MNIPEIHVESWEKAFAGPLANTRQIEKQLRNDITANKDRLRTLVGASYRDLLETAERIVHLDGQMQETVKLLGDTSLQCSLDVVNQKAAALREVHQQQAQKKHAGHQLAAQLRLLDRCSRCLPRITRRGGSLLTAAKVLALSRVLNKSISQGDDPPHVLDPIRGQLSSERRQLLTRIRVHMTRSDSNVQQLIDAICAFCIATSSSSNDGIRHLQDLRYEEIRQLLTSSENLSENFLSAFEYYLSSLSITRRLLGRPLADAFREVRNQPVLEASDVSTLPDLALDSVRGFMSREILSFVPFLKHQDANQDQVVSALLEWSRTSFQALILGLAQTVATLRKPADLFEFRERVMKIWLPSSASAPVHSRDEIFARLRNTLNTRIQEVIREEMESLKSVSDKICIAVPKSISEKQSSLRLWDQDFLSAPLGDGCVSFKNSLTDRQLGQSKTSNRIFSSMQKWTRKISDTAEKIQKLRKRRWIDVIEEDDTDHEQASLIEGILQTKDSDIFSSCQSSSLSSTLHTFEISLQALTSSLSPSSPTDSVIFLVRTIRTIHHILSISPSTQNLDLNILVSLAHPLHAFLATHIAQTLPKSRPRKPSAALAHLWTGSPPLPSLPSPQIYKFLQCLTRAMEEMGTDLWCLEAVEAVKKGVRETSINHASLISVDGGWIANGVEGPKKDEVNGDGEIEAEEAARIGVLQALFDGFYLLEALKLGPNGAEMGDNDGENRDGLQELVDKTKEKTREIDQDKAEEVLETMEQRAQAYWAWTLLLFGILG